MKKKDLELTYAGRQQNEWQQTTEKTSWHHYPGRNGTKHQDLHGYLKSRGNKKNETGIQINFNRDKMLKLCSPSRTKIE